MLPLLIGIIMSTNPHSYTVGDVDWDLLQDLTVTYMCTGNRDWHEELARKALQHQAGIEHHEQLVLVLTMYSGKVILCENHANIQTSTRFLYYKLFRPVLISDVEFLLYYAAAFYQLGSRLLCCPEQTLTFFAFMTQRFKDDYQCFGRSVRVYPNTILQS